MLHCVKGLCCEGELRLLQHAHDSCGSDRGRRLWPARGGRTAETISAHRGKTGDLVDLPFRPLGDDETRRFLYEIMTPEQKTRFDEDGELDFAYDLKGVARFRVNLRCRRA